MGQLTSPDPHLLDPLLTNLYVPAKEIPISPELSKASPLIDGINKPTLTFGQSGETGKFQIFWKKKVKYGAFLGLGFAAGFLTAKYFFN